MKNRIREIRRSRNMTMKELGSVLGVSESAISQYETGKRQPDNETLYRLSDFFGESIGYILGVEERSAHFLENVMEVPPMKRVPLVGTIACGEPILAEQNIEGEVSVPENVRADFCLRCKGDSMTGARINDGDLVFIRQQPTVDDGQIAAVLIGDEATLKRVYHQGEMLVLAAENAAYKPMICTPDQEIRVLGLAVAFLSTIS